jgi:hypothetical protein
MNRLIQRETTIPTTGSDNTAHGWKLSLRTACPINSGGEHYNRKGANS